jgi:hypothetical protein
MLLLSIDSKSHDLVISGSINEIINNNRLYSIIKNDLDGVHKDNKIIISIDKDNSLSSLEDIVETLDYFELDYTYDKNADEILNIFKKEEENFTNFSIRAKNIRNLKFTKEDEADFENFKIKLEKLLPKRTLYEKQYLSAYHLTFSQNACNFSVPGAGKTSIVYAAFAYLNSLNKDHPKYVEKLFVFGPLSSFGPWETEYSEIFDAMPSFFRLSGNHTKEEKKNQLYSPNPKNIFLSSYPSLLSIKDDIINFLKRFKVMVVLDEAHYIKNTEGGLISNSALDLAPYANSRVILTGTPAPNGYEDLHNLFDFIWPSKHVIKFNKNQLRSMTERTILKNSTNKLIDYISPYFIRIKKKHLGLNDPVENAPIIAIMGPLQKKIYLHIERLVSRDIKRDTSGFSSKLLSARLIRLMQAATNPSLLIKPIDEFYFEGPNSDSFVDDEETMELIKTYHLNEVPQKFIETIEIIKNIIKRGEKVIVWFNFIYNIHHFSEILNNSKINSRIIYGGVPLGNKDDDDELEFTREKIIKDFHDSNSNFNVLIANTASISESISLHKACNNAIYVERDFNAGRFAQSKDRIHRYGMDNDIKVNYHYVLSDCATDQTIHDRLEEKVDRMIKIMERDEIPLFNIHSSSEVSEDMKALLRNYAKSN